MLDYNFRASLSSAGRITRALVALLLVLLALSSVASSRSFSLCQALGGPGLCREVRLLAAGVTSDGASLRGFPVSVYVAVASGSGLIFAQAELSADEYFTTFNSMAVLVAAVALGVNLSRYSYYVYLDPPIAKVVGPSSSAAVGLATALALLNYTPPEPIAVVGILLPDGGFGYVGYADEKVLSLADRARLVLVPRSQNLSRSTLRFCEERGVRVVEVADLYEALQFLGGFTAGSMGGDDWGYLRQLLSKWVALVNESVKRYLESFKSLCRGLEYSEVSALAGPLEVAVVLRLLAVVRNAWTCGLESGILSLSDVVAEVRGKIARLSEEYWEWSRLLPISAETLVVLSEVYAALLRAVELFNRTVDSSANLVEAVEDLAVSYTIAESALAALKALRGTANVLMSERVVSLSRLSAIYRYASNLYLLLRNSPIAVGLAEELELVESMLSEAGALLAKDPAATLALCVRSLVKMTKPLYLDQYRDSQRTLEALRSRAVKLSSTSAIPVLRLYVGLGDVYASLGTGFEEVLEAYLGTSVRGLVYTILLSSFTGPTYVPTPSWYLFALLPLALGLPLTLLLRRARGSSARRTLRSYLQLSPPPRSWGSRKLRTTHRAPLSVLPALVGPPHPELEAEL